MSQQSETCGLCGIEVVATDDGNWQNAKEKTLVSAFPMPHFHNPDLRTMGQIHQPDLVPDAVEPLIEERL